MGHRHPSPSSTPTPTNQILSFLSTFHTIYPKYILLHPSTPLLHPPSSHITSNHTWAIGTLPPPLPPPLPTKFFHFYPLFTQSILNTYSSTPLLHPPSSHITSNHTWAIGTLPPPLPPPLPTKFFHFYPLFTQSILNTYSSTPLLHHPPPPPPT